MTLAAVLTTISEPTSSVHILASRVRQLDVLLVVAGDAKGPFQYSIPQENSYDQLRVALLTINDQVDGPFDLGRRLPTKHYCRKNIGYLHAIAAGATCVYETDDDNAPLDCWMPREESVTAAAISASSGCSPRWVNVYTRFSNVSVWPRGIPLDHINSPLSLSNAGAVNSGVTLIRAPIQQGLVNGSPDVDAIWRLTQDREFEFDNAPSVVVQPGNWCPFNTQSTWWWPVAYPLLYIPSYCTFRMCDIWKSFVAQRCLWELGLGVVFHAPEVYQDRNPHNLMKDFEDEIPGYLQNHRIAEILEKTPLKGGEENVANNLLSCYEALVRENIFPEKELDLVKTWLEDLQKCKS